VTSGRHGRILLGGTVVGVIVVGVVEAALRSLDLTLFAFLFAAVGIGALTLIGDGLRQWYADASSRDQRAAELESALAAWPLPSVEHTSPYDLGVSPETDGAESGQYARRPVDDRLESAVHTAEVVLVTGPPGAGKTRGAFEALRRCEPHALLIVPRDGRSLTKILQAANDLLAGWPMESPVRHVLWLDDLERFLPELGVDALDRFQQADLNTPTEGVAEPPGVHPLEQRLPSTLKTAADFARKHLDSSSSRAPVKIVATIRDVELRTITSRGGEGAIQLRRFVARASGVPMPARPGRAQRLRRRLRKRTLAPARALYQPRVGDRTQPPAVSGHSPLPASLKLGAACLLLSVVLLGGLAALSNVVKPAPPKPLGDQLADIRAKGTECGGVETSPREASLLHRDTTLVALSHEADGCTASDELTIYRSSDGRLRPVKTFRFDTESPPQRLSCIGPERPDPCHAEVTPGFPVVILGARDVASQQVLPVAIWSLTRGPKIMALHLPQPAGRRLPASAQTAQALNGTRVQLRLSRDAGEARRACPVDCLMGYAAAAVSVVGPSGEGNATLVAGRVVRGAFNAPKQLAVQGYELALIGGRPEVSSPCLLERNGRRLAIRTAIRPHEGLTEAVRSAWMRARVTATEVKCRPLPPDWARGRPT
jgi:hypothetical protein